MSTLILLNKPYAVLCQFTDNAGRGTLADYVDIPDVYPAGRLDYDSEGLVLLCDDGQLQARIASPRFKMWKTYYLQLEGTIDLPALQRLREGVQLKDGVTLPARVEFMQAPRLWTRTPAIRQRANQPVSWIKIQIREGKNRQLRRMCAAVGFPVLRLVRMSIGDWSVEGMQPGEQRQLKVHLPRSVPSNRPAPAKRRR